MISRHLDLDRNRGALIAAQSVFQSNLQGCSIKELQAFSSLTMRTFRSIPAEDWPSQRMLGEWLFHQLRLARKLERAIDLINRSDPSSHERDFSFLWERLWQLLVEEREDANARACIEMSLKSPKKASQPATKTPAVPAKAPPATVHIRHSRQITLLNALLGTKRLCSAPRSDCEKDWRSNPKIS